MFRLELLGGFQLSVQGRLIDLSRRPRLQALLAYLALNRHHPQTRATIVTALWPDAGESSGRNRLRNLLHQLRQVLPERDDLITIGPSTLQWRADLPDNLDIARFEAELMLAAGQNDAHTSELHLAHAVELYVGDLVPDCGDEWIEHPRRLFRHQLTDALGQLIALAEARQAWDVAEEYAQRLLRHDPLHEAAYCRAMQLHARRGDMAGVMRIYAQCCDVLSQELDVEPSAATQSLYRQLTTQDVTLSPAPAEAPRIDKPATLVGREEEWRELQRLWQQVQNGESRLVVIQGEAGIGKTRLSQDFLRWVEREHIYVASANCYAVEGALAFGPVAEWLRTEVFWQSLGTLEDEWIVALVRLLPELRSRFQQIPDLSQQAENLQRQHFFTALAVALLEHGQPVLLFLDDLQWADQETLDWLHYLIRYETPTPLLVLATLRTDDAAERARCQPLLRELARNNRCDEITLLPLSVEDTTVLAQQLLGSEIYATYAGQLYAETDGNPFFIVETVWARPHSFVKSKTEDRTIDLDDRETVHHLPPKIHALIEQRLARLSPLATEIVQLAAVIGRRFDDTLLVPAIKRDEEELVQGVEELWEQRIIREAPQNSFDFVHDMVRVVVYAALSPVRRRYFHEKIARELVALSPIDQSESSGQIAAHFEAAGVLRESIKYYVLAAAHDAHTFAFRHAERAYADAIRLGTQIGLPVADLGPLYINRGRMLELSDDYPNAVAVYRELDSRARADGHQELELEAVARLVVCHIEPTMVHDRAMAIPLLARGMSVARRTGNRTIEIQLQRTRMVDAAHYGYEKDAYAAGEAAIAAARAESLSVELATVLNDHAAHLRLSGRQHLAQGYADEAQALLRSHGNLPLLVDNLAQQAWSDLHQMKFESAVAMADQSIDLCHEINNTWNLCLAYQTKAQVKAAIGAWGDAISLFEQAIDFGRESGLALARVMPANLLGDLLRTIGQFARSEALHQSAYAVAKADVPFLVHALEAQLAMNAYARNRIATGDRWLSAALEHQPPGAIGRAWCTLPDIARAAVMGSEQSARWQDALNLTQSALDEAHERALPLHIPPLLLAKSRCLIALDQFQAAERVLEEVADMTKSPLLHPIWWQLHQLRAYLLHRRNRIGEAHQHDQLALAERSRLATSLGDPELAGMFRTP